MVPSISVCIPVYGTEGSLLDCLHSVAAQQGLEAAGLEACGGRDVAKKEVSWYVRRVF